MRDAEVKGLHLLVVLDFARQVGAPTPLTEASLPWYEAAIEQGHREEDTAALFSVLRDRATPSP